jgi:hypothetical protein
MKIYMCFCLYLYLEHNYPVYLSQNRKFWTDIEKNEVHTFAISHSIFIEQKGAKGTRIVKGNSLGN